MKRKVQPSISLAVLSTSVSLSSCGNVEDAESSRATPGCETVSEPIVENSVYTPYAAQRSHLPPTPILDEDLNSISPFGAGSRSSQGDALPSSIDGLELVAVQSDSTVTAQYFAETEVGPTETRSEVFGAGGIELASRLLGADEAPMGGLIEDMGERAVAVTVDGGRGQAAVATTSV